MKMLGSECRTWSMTNGAVGSANPRVDARRALAIAIQLQKNEQLVEAEVVYRASSSCARPWRGLALAGVLAHQQGPAPMRRADREEPGLFGTADYYNNLGIVLQARGRFDDAIGAYHHAIALDPNHANAHSNLGVLLRATGKPVEAEAAYRTAIGLDPQHIDAYANLGILLNG